MAIYYLKSKAINCSVEDNFRNLANTLDSFNNIILEMAKVDHIDCKNCPMKRTVKRTCPFGICKMKAL